MVEELLKTLAVMLHFGIDCQNFSRPYSWNAVFSEALLLSQMLQEICYRWVSEHHAQLEGHMPAFNVVIGLLVTVSRIFELIPEID